jgi:hypothetical protein
MSNLFKNMKTEGLEESQDRLGGFQAVESGIYVATIKNLFAGESKHGAMSLTLIASLENGSEYRETLYITNRQKENFFINKGTNKKSPLPGFTIANDLCLIATGKELYELQTEEKVVKVWDPDTKSEVPKSVPVITEVLNQKVALGILKQLENKSEKQGDEYVPTAETRETNLIDKVFHPEHRITVAEARGGKTDPQFWDAWLKRNEGQTRDKRTVKEGQAATGAPPKAGGKGASAAPRKSLFGK